MDGSFTTTPEPLANTQVLAVPRSIARSTPLTRTPFVLLEGGNARAFATSVPLRAEVVVSGEADAPDPKRQPPLRIWRGDHEIQRGRISRTCRNSYALVRFDI